ncbi:MAG: rod shape-determining protein RodA, partial [Nocardioides sp.]|nr:rod shape-determining protein RodA [Nocardioides sp.]
TGVPLPLVSYGVSSLFEGMLAIGLLQNIHLRSTAQVPTRYTMPVRVLASR